MNHLLYRAFKYSGLNKLVFNLKKNKCHGIVEINRESVKQAEILLHALLLTLATVVFAKTA